MTNGGLIILTEMLEKLPPSEKKIAAYILDHPHESISLTANELGKRSSTSGAAVIRLCKSLHLKGFQDLKLRIAGDLQKPDDHVGYQDIQPNESTSSIIKKMTDNSIQTIRETADLLNTEELKKAVDALREARQIHFIGVGASSIAAEDAQHKFLRIDKTVYAFKDMHMAATLVANTSADDVVVGISFSGETQEITKILQLANENQATTISLTKYGSSNVGDQAKINLYTSATNEPTFRSGATSSRVAQLQVIDILFMCVASLQYEDSVKHLGATRDAVDFLKWQW
ncbi:RpiR family transcriptional regulator [Virgibacillus dokdonensis]|uniref:DNA-binding transcriptional regulator, MurR/RpiR family, contains HTH and SIS domains n=2 Tax=Virgibacillus TaxID=84406 RepID=A0A1M5QQJ8_9BACI|nr:MULTISPECIES: MurR/RpiR family transcriptional regulator [Virgibacillus]RFA32788.1 RpiR family transcriptional regulator [Virgibacillus dokdonensis]SHH16226.1 DNA-binding transcriptional regulator, MurR/RpiR family, contains HTH and SIS domains [Virgibacillus chiguensis]